MHGHVAALDAGRARCLFSFCRCCFCCTLFFCRSCHSLGCSLSHSFNSCIAIQGIERIQCCLARHGRSCQSLDAVLAEGERSGLADELLRKACFFAHLGAKSRCLIRSVDRQRRYAAVVILYYMHGHVAAFDAGRARCLFSFYRCCRSCIRLCFSRGCSFHCAFGRGFFHCRKQGLVTLGNNAVQGIQNRSGGDGSTGDCFNTILSVCERSHLADELAGKAAVGSSLAQAVGLIRRIDAQCSDGIVCIQADGYRHVTAKALHGRGYRLCGLCSAAFHDRIQSRNNSVGRKGRSGESFNAILTVGKRSALADELAGKGLLRGHLAQAIGLIRRIDGKVFDRAVIRQTDIYGNRPAEALFRGRYGRSGINLFLLHQAELIGIDIVCYGIDPADNRTGGGGSTGYSIHAIFIENDRGGFSLELIRKLCFLCFGSESGCLRKVCAADRNTGDHTVHVNAGNNLDGTAKAGDRCLSDIADHIARFILALKDVVQIVLALFDFKFLDLSGCFKNL